MIILKRDYLILHILAYPRDRQKYFELSYFSLLISKFAK